MIATPNPETQTKAARRSLRVNLTLTRVIAAGGIVIGALAIAAPSWAGPMMGC